MIHYIHCHQGFDMNKGGSVGYLSSLRDGMERLGSFSSAAGLQHAFLFPNIGPDERLPNIAVPQLEGQPPFEAAYEDSEHKLYRDDSHMFHACMPTSEALKINLRKITSIHIHGAYNFLPVYNFLRVCGIQDDVVKILTTHNPWKPELEDMFHIQKSLSVEMLRERKKELEARAHFLRLRDECAFRLSDALFFPDPASLEGYYETWPEFAEIVKGKKIYFSATGTERKNISTSREEMRQQLGIPQDAIVFLYLGRFIPMRGFDVYVESATEVLRREENVWFLAVGEERGSPSINHPRWIQLGFTDKPGDFINCADACVSGNRGSLFDLSMIEILSIGTPLVATKVGGYKFLEGRTSGVHFFERDSAHSMTEALVRFTRLSGNELEEQRRENRRLYESALTPQDFARGYFSAIDRLYLDFQVAEKDRNIVRVPMSLGRTQEVHGPGKVFLVSSNIAGNPAREFPKGASANTESIEDLVKVAKVSLGEDNPRQAVEILSACVNKAPQNAHIRRVIAEALVMTGSKVEAIMHLTHAHKLLPNNKAIARRLKYLRHPLRNCLSKGRLPFTFNVDA